jgi:hypothetical protein
VKAALAEILESARVFVCRPEGDILQWSAGCCEMYGYTAKEAVGRSSLELLKTEYPEPPERIAETLTWEGRWSGRLRQGSWEHAHLADLINAIGGGLGIQDRLAASGPDVAIGADDAMGLSLALHELCTNAVKYGALSNLKGKVLLTWETIKAEQRQWCASTGRRLMARQLRRPLAPASEHY